MFADARILRPALLRRLHAAQDVLPGRHRGHLVERDFGWHDRAGLLPDPVPPLPTHQAQKMEAIGRLAGGVAHDFNNLLTVIHGYNEMLREHLTHDETGADYTAEIHKAAERAGALTNQLLAFSRRQLAAPRIVNLNHSVQQIEKMLHRIIGEDVDLELRLAPAVSPVRVDPAHIDQVIMNLAVNSRDAMPDGGKLTMETAHVEL